MRALLIALVVVVPVLLVLFAWMSAFNRLVQVSQHVTESWRDVDVELSRRHQLIPNLMRVVSAYAAHEHTLLEQLAAERGLLAGPVGVVAERYPQLSASGNYQQLAAELVETEDRLAAARRIYNGNVSTYNALLEMFPSGIVARSRGFQAAAYYEFEAAPPALSPD